jgi:hypothetical protein
LVLLDTTISTIVIFIIGFNIARNIGSIDIFMRECVQFSKGVSESSGLPRYKHEIEHVGSAAKND